MMRGSVRQVKAGGGSPCQVSEVGKQVREGEARLVPSPSVQGSHKSSEGSSARGLIIAIGTLLQTLPFGIVRRPHISLCVAL